MYDLKERAPILHKYPSNLPNLAGSIADRSFHALNALLKTKHSAAVYSSFQTLKIHPRNIYIYHIFEAMWLKREIFVTQ